MPKDRIVLLDALRGLAILGIMLCNIPLVDVPERVAESIPFWPLGQAPASVAVWLVTQIFFQQKFYTLFGMLFGASVLLVGGEGGDRERTVMIVKRLVALLVIGLVHGLLIWQGDVMSYYAIVGLLVILVRGWPAWRLLWAGIAIHLIDAAWDAYKLLIHARHLIKPADAKLLAKIAADTHTDMARYTAGFMSSLIQNAHQNWDFVTGSWSWPPMWPLKVLGLMLMGMGLFKLGVLKGEASARTYKSFIAIGLGCMTLVALLFGVYVATPGWVALLGALASRVQASTAPLVSLGYLGLLALAARTRVWSAIPRILAPAGQMAFTNYLAQSVIMTTIFYGGRGPGLYGTLDRPALAGIVAASWLAQILWSHWWLKRFNIGPLEWLWRLAYRGRTPLRRAAEAA